MGEREEREKEKKTRKHIATPITTPSKRSRKDKFNDTKKDH
jgi:hypothetical protein